MSSLDSGEVEVWISLDFLQTVIFLSADCIAKTNTDIGSENLTERDEVNFA